MIPKIPIPGDALLYQMANENGLVTYNGSVLELNAINLGLVSTQAVTVNLQGLFRDATGNMNVISDSFVVQADNLTRRNSFTKQYPLAIGKLISANVTCNSVVFQVYASLRVRYSNAATAPIVMDLASGYAGAGVSVSFPSSGKPTQYDSQGIATRIQFASPALGAEFQTSIPFRVAFVVYACRFKLVTAAAGAARTAYVFVQALTRTYYLADHTQAAGSTHSYMFHPQAAAVIPVVLNVNEEHLGVPVICKMEDILGIGANGLNAGDQISEVEFCGYYSQVDS